MTTCGKDDVSFLPTSSDHIDSMLYALDKVAKERCTDPDILKIYPGLKWVKKDQFRIYPCLDGLECEHGRCVIGTKEQCLSQSQLPWKDDGNEFDDILCKTDDDCKKAPFQPAKCGKTKDNVNKCMPKDPYLEWRDDKCIYGNVFLRKYCQFPKYRRATSVHGATDVPPFRYDPSNGKCYITGDYCDWMGLDFDSSTPECTMSEFQKIFEQYFVGKTIFRDLKKVHEGFQKLDFKLKKLVDKRFISNLKLINKDFVGKRINLYLITWKDEVRDKVPNMITLGFIADEIKRVYPRLVYLQDGFEYIVITREDINLNKDLKRIYGVCGSSSWMVDLLYKYIPQKKNIF